MVNFRFWHRTVRVPHTNKKKYKNRTVLIAKTVHFGSLNLVDLLLIDYFVVMINSCSGF